MGLNELLPLLRHFAFAVDPLEDPRTPCLDITLRQRHPAKDLMGLNYAAIITDGGGNEHRVVFTPVTAGLHEETSDGVVYRVRLRPPADAASGADIFAKLLAHATLHNLHWFRWAAFAEIFLQNNAHSTRRYDNRSHKYDQVKPSGIELDDHGGGMHRFGNYREV